MLKSFEFLANMEDDSSKQQSATNGDGGANKDDDKAAVQIFRRVGEKVRYPRTWALPIIPLTASDSFEFSCASQSVVHALSYISCSMRRATSGSK